MGSEARVSLLICDDHRVLTDALKLVIETEGSMDLVAAPCPTPEQAVALCARLGPDVVLMDIRFPGETNGIEATRLIKQVSSTTKVVIMTAHEEESMLAEAVEAGASGFLSKTAAIADVLGAVRSAAEGEVLIDPATLTKIMRRVAKERQATSRALASFEKVTDREMEVLELLAQGLRNEEIAARLGISPQTVQTHVRNILPKLGVHSKLEAVTFAVKNGVVAV